MQDASPAAPVEEAPAPAPQAAPQESEEVETQAGPDAEELQPVKLVKSPLAPSAAEVQEHEATGHVVYRSWCPICQAARSTGQPHLKAPAEDETAVPQILWDYGYLGADDGKSLPLLVVKDRRTKRVAATFVQAKGSDPYAIKFGSSFLESTGYRQVVLKSDGEPSIVALKARCAEEARVEGVPQESGPGDHQANGEIEAAVREVKRQCRVLKYALESKLGRQLKDDDPMLAWVPRHAADLICRYRRGEDGKTPEQRRTGKQWRKPALEFGERVLFREARADPGARLSTFAPVMEEGRYIGHHGRTGVLLVMTKEGVRRGLSFRRVPEEQRWTTDGWEELKGFPWEVKPRERSLRVPAVGGDEAPQPVIQPLLVPPEGPRRLYVLERDVKHFNPTPGCPGCDAVIATGKTQPGHAHNQACRERFIELLGQDEAGRRRLEDQRRRERRGASRAAQGPAPAAAQGQGQDDQAEQPAAEAAGAPPPRLPFVGERRGKRRRTAQPAPEPETGTGAAGSGGARGSASDTRGQGADGDATMHRPAPAMPVISLGQQKRSAPDAGEDPRLEVSPAGPGASGSSASGSGGPDVESVLAQPVAPSAAAAPGSAAAYFDAGSREEVEAGALTEHKAEILDLVKAQVFSHFRHCGSDISERDAHNIALMSVEIGAVDVAEIYSPHRVTARAAEFGLRPGFAVDLLEEKPSGGHWDLGRPEDVEELERLQEEQDPFLLCGSPPCTPFSRLQAFNKGRSDPAKVQAKLEEGRHHLNTAIAAYRRQMGRGRVFLHEHPASATSWEEPEMKALQGEDGVYTVQGPMCRWNLQPAKGGSQDGVPAFCRKETCWVTNSKRLANRLEGVCSNVDGSRPWHRHVHLTQSLGHFARVYTPELVAAILEECRADVLDCGSATEAELRVSGPTPDEPTVPEGPWTDYWDDVNGGYLDNELVKAARAKEREWVQKQGIYDIVPRQQCWDRTGRAPIPLKWVDTNKGDHQRPNVRSRLVAKEIKAKKKGTPDELGPGEVFSSMPPLEAFMALVSLWVALVPKGYKLAMFDISRAHFYGVAKREVYVELESEDLEQYGSDKCGLLRKSMYGTQDAAQIWQEDYTGLLVGAGFRRGVSNGAVFHQPDTDVRVLVHGDDFLVLGKQAEIDSFEALLRSRYELKKLANLGLAPADDKSGVFLNRVVQVLEGSRPNRARVAVEPDSRHARLVVRELGLEGAKGTDVPMPKRSAEQQFADWETPALGPEAAKVYRSCTMRVAYLAQDRVDLGEAAKTLARFMQQPTEGAMGLLKRVARYLIKHPQTRRVFEDTKFPEKIRVYVDSDHAGCAVARKSTTGYVVRLGHNTVKHGSNLQSTTALSSGESEYYALVKAGKEGLGFQSLLQDWGLHLPLEVSSDSSAARGHIARRGLGKMRHIQTRYLWIQERVGEGHLVITSVPGDKNIADILTKCVPGVTLTKHLRAAGFEYAEAHKSQRGLL